LCFVIGFLVSFIAPEIQWTNSILGILLGGGSLLLVAVVYEKITGSEGMGGGDVKLLAMIGAFLGWKGVLFTVMASSLFGTAIGGALMLLSGKGRKLAIPFGPFLPGSEAHEKNRQRTFRFSKEKKRIIKSLDLLVIDEISMVRADLLDAVDAVLRRPST